MVQVVVELETKGVNQVIVEHMDLDMLVELMALLLVEIVEVVEQVLLVRLYQVLLQVMVEQEKI
tara:strand:- start:149 stop:340 length:192 start_codon:yes stop_codon:yes gene_type:complete